jgi:predicted GIY-YIG superfamily endonuclease
LRINLGVPMDGSDRTDVQSRNAAESATIRLRLAGACGELRAARYLWERPPAAMRIMPNHSERSGRRQRREPFANAAARGFTSRYGVHLLVWFECYDDVLNAITREKELKKWRREWKINLIEGSNPEWVDLYAGIAS